MVDAAPPCDWDICSFPCSEDEWDSYSSTVRAAALRYATAVIWAATGRRYGLCETTVRPCGRFCEESGSGWWWSYGQWLPYVMDGVWRNCYCGTGSGCNSCQASCQVWLPGPVAEITEVTISGSPVVTGSYELQKADGAYWLVRLEVDGTNDCWPYHQDFDRPLGEEDTWSVTYLKGIAVPQVLLDAAGVMAVEYARSCVGADCRLPQRIQNLTRQGVSMSMPPIDQLLKNGLTGITEVDQIITSFNPFGLKGRPRMASVELARRVRYPGE